MAPQSVEEVEEAFRTGHARKSTPPPAARKWQVGHASPNAQRAVDPPSNFTMAEGIFVPRVDRWLTASANLAHSFEPILDLSISRRAVMV
jgi:hypothetical protein